MSNLFDPTNQTAFELLSQKEEQQPFTINKDNYQQANTSTNTNTSANGMTRNQKIGYMLAAISDAFAGRDVAGRAMARAQAIRQQAEIDRQRKEALKQQKKLIESSLAAEAIAKKRFAGNENMAILFRNNSEFARDFLLKELETPGVNVGPQGQKFGSPPTDTVWRRDAEGQIVLSANNTPIADPIPGTKLFQTRKNLEESKGKQQDKSIVESGLVLGNLDRIRNRVEDASWFDPATGFGVGLTKNIAGSTAADVGELIKTINASIGFSALQAMRDASPTGGALGQVSEREIDLLQSTIASLNQNQSEEQFLENLNLIDTYYTNIIRKFNAFPAEVMAQVGYIPRELNRQKIKDFIEIDGYKIKPKQ